MFLFSPFLFYSDCQDYSDMVYFCVLCERMHMQHEYEHRNFFSDFYLSAFYTETLSQRCDARQEMYMTGVGLHNNPNH